MVQIARRSSFSSLITSWFATIWEKRQRKAVLSAARQGDFAPLLSDAETALDETLWQCGSDHPSTARRLAALAAVHGMRGDIKEAEPLFRRAIAILWSSKDAIDHIEAVTLSEQFAELLRSNERFADAESVYTDLLHQCQIAYQGEPHADVARTLDNLALTLKEQGKTSAAKEHHRDALRVWESICGSGSGEVARCLTHLASLYLDERRYEEAEPLLERAVAEWKGSNNPQDLYAIVTLSCSANLYRSTGRGEQAKKAETAAKGILALYAK